MFPKAPKLFSQAVFPAFGEATQLGDLISGAEAGFPPLAFPHNTGVQSTKTPGSRLLHWVTKAASQTALSLYLHSNSSGLDSTSFRWHACVQQIQHFALWLWCVLFRPPLFCLPIFSYSLQLSSGVVELINRTTAGIFGMVFLLSRRG